MLADQNARDRATQELDKNIIVVAGAGTGKTTLLVERFLRILLIEQVPITRIAALTFTEKAANEMKVRLIEKIEKLLIEEGIPSWLAGTYTTASTLRARLQGILDDMDKSHVGTIHSFCAHLLRLFPLEAGVPPDFQVDEGDATEELFEGEWNRWLEQELGRDAARGALWLSLLESATLQDVRDLAASLVSFKTPIESIRAASADGQQPPGIRTALEAALPFVESFRAGYLEAGWISFEGLLLLTRDLLKNNPGARKRIKKEFTKLLVDEFQDTDPLQAEIIFFIAERDGDHATELSKIRLQSGKLFLVGDPKQSIYSFRGANIEAYERARERIGSSGGAQCELTTNFRSHEGIIHVVNPLFEKIIEENPPLQPRYVPIDAYSGHRKEFPFQKAEMILVEEPGQELKADEARVREAEAILEVIRQIVGKVKIEGESGKRRSAQYKDIAVLFRKFSSLKHYLHALKRENVPYIVEGEKIFYSTPEITNFMNLLTALDHPHDRIALMGYLRSPFCGLSDREIRDLASAGDWNYLDPSPGRPERAEQAFAQLRRLHALTHERPVGELIHAVFEETFILELAAASFHGEQVVANLLKIESQARTLSGERGITLKEFIRRLKNRVQERKQEGESPLSDEKQDAVRLLTIHKAKGLEFPFVIVADMHGMLRHAGPKDSNVEVITEWPDYRLGIEIGDVANLDFDAIEKRQKERQEAEERRNLYVAMTRAKDQLVLTGSIHAGPKTYLGYLAGAMGVALPEIKQTKITFKEGELEVMRFSTPEPAYGESRSAPPKVPAAAPPWKSYHKTWEERRHLCDQALSERLLLSPTALQGHTRKYINDDDQEITGRPSAALWTRLPATQAGGQVGQLCHRVMELWDFRDATLSKTIERVIGDVSPMEWGGADPGPIDKEIRGIFATFSKSDPMKELRQAKILGREIPFVMAWNGQAVHGVMDVIYRNGDDVVVADYKTDRVELGKESAKGEAYSSQREIYTEAVRRALGLKTVHFKLIFLRTGRMV